ncbi:MAG: OmpA family protein [Cryomorphaceae bacterium]|nr:OmpA family protein [Cryomorphaceae bacterium]
MKKVLVLSLLSLLTISCVSKKKFTALEGKQKETADKLSQAKMELAACLDDKKKTSKEIEYLRSVNYKLAENVGELSLLSRKEAENLQSSLESLREKDLQIRTMQQAMNKKDSVTLALVKSLKGAIGNLDDEDISIDVEKGVVFVSISDKFLFKSGSFAVNQEGKAVLKKVAKIIESRPGFEVMVEGHTDDKPISTECMQDNWDLSVKRATSIVRILQDDYSIAPNRLTAAGRSEFIPVASNDDVDGRAKNRRTRIVIMPKLDEFYGMIEDELAKLKK